MKPFAAGQLLDAKASPFGQALTNYQCIQYVLDRPGVLTLVAREWPDAHTVRDGFLQFVLFQ